MKKLLWLVPAALLAFGTVAIAKGKKAPKKAKAPKAVAALVCEQDSLDLGEIEAGTTKDVAFTIKNTGKGQAKNVACKATGFKFARFNVDAESDFELKGTYKAPKKCKKAKALKATIRCGKLKIKVVGKIVPKAKAAAE